MHAPRISIETSLVRRWQACVGWYATRPALVDGQLSMDYAALDRASNAIANALLQRGPLAGERVALLAAQGASAVQATLAILKAGAAYVPLDPGLPAPLLRAQLASAAPRAIVADAQHLPFAQALGMDDMPALAIDALTRHPDTRAPQVTTGPDTLAYVYYTSGSTGQPKGVYDNHRNVLHNVWRYSTNLHITAHDRLTLLQAPHFSGAVSSQFAALLNGAACLPFDIGREGLAAIGPWLRAQHITMFHAVPTIYREIAAGGPYPALRCIRLEGDQATARDVALFQRHAAPGAVLANGLGATECGLVRQWRITPTTLVAPGPPPIGDAVHDMEVLLLDEQRRALAPGEIGQIAVRSRYLALGYWGQPELTAQRFLPDPHDCGARIYLTGDLGRLRPDGLLQYLGRRDLTSKLHGQWVDTDAVEDALHGVPGVHEAAVAVRRRGADEAPCLVAYVVPAPGAVLDLAALRTTLAQRLPPAQVPTAWITLAQLPRSGTLKIDRAALPALPPSDATMARTAAPDTLEAQLCALWCEVLLLPSLGENESVLAHGADSLAMMRMHNRLSDLGLTLPVALLFEHPTPAALALALTEFTTSPAAPSPTTR